jgi:TPR repeat protein
MASNASIEQEAKQKVEAAQLYFSKAPDTSFALSALYRDGSSDDLPHVIIEKTDFKKAAYWMIEAAKSDHEEAQKYLESLVPQYEKHLYKVDFVDVLAKKLAKQDQKMIQLQKQHSGSR